MRRVRTRLLQAAIRYLIYRSYLIVKVKRITVKCPSNTNEPQSLSAVPASYSMLHKIIGCHCECRRRQESEKKREIADEKGAPQAPNYNNHSLK